MPGNVAAKPSGKMYAMNCDCGFQLKDHNRAEMVEIGQVHLKMTHPDMKMQKAQIEGMIKPA